MTAVDESNRYWLERNDALAIGALAVVAILARIALWGSYEPFFNPDSVAFLNTARYLATLDFSGYTGFRTPAYPMLLVALDSSPRAAWLVQCVLGVATSVLLYLFARRITGSARLGLAAGLLHTLVLNQLFFEAAILSEAPAAFCIVLFVVAATHALAREPSLAWAIGLGLLASLTTLLRPVYVFLGPLLLLFFLFAPAWRRVAPLATFSVSFAVPLLGWSLFNKAMIGFFGLTSLIGFNLSNHAGAFMERAPDEYAQIRDIYIDYRDRKLAQGRTHAMTIFEALPELKERTGLTVPELSKKFTALSLRVIADHPLAYMRSVAESWASFWIPQMYWDPASISGAAAREFMVRAWKIQRPAVIGLMAVFLAGSLVFFQRVVTRWNSLDAGDWSVLFAAAVVLSSSGVQALLEFGDNPRYGVPTQSLALTLVAIFLWKLSRVTIDRARGRRAGGLAIGP